MRPKLPTALLVILGLIAGLLVSIASPVVEPSAQAEAVPAPTTPLPQCVVDDEGREGLGCVPGDLEPIVSGAYADGGSFTIDAGQLGLAACASYVSTGCYYDVFAPSLSRCVYLHDNDPTDVRSCSGSLSTSGSVTGELELVENIDDGTAQPEPQDVRVRVTVKNEIDTPISNIELPEELVIIDTDSPDVGVARLVNTGGPFEVDSTTVEVSRGPFSLDGKEERVVDYLLEARDDASLDVRADVSYTAPTGGFAVSNDVQPYRIGVGALLGI